MKEIQIFLASSIVDFKKERLEMHDFVQKLSKITEEKHKTALYLVKCENIENCVKIGGMQPVYDREIEKSDIVLFLFDRAAGKYTLGELDIAARSFSKDSLKEHICIMCRYDPYKTEGNGFEDLAAKLNKYRIPREIFDCLDKVKTALMLKLIALM